MMKKILLALILGVPLAAAAKDISQKEGSGVQQYYAKKLLAADVMYTQGLLTSWSATASGGAASFYIQHATGTIVSAGDFAIHQSSSIFLLAGQTYSDIPLGHIQHATITVTSLDAGATFYFRAGVLQPR